jgi:galactitol-specific phosphotransferase system IIC component
VERETGLPGISASPVSVNGLVPYAVCVDWLLDRIPVINKLNYNPHSKGDEPTACTGLDLLGEPMIIGGLMGLALAIAAGYGLGATLELAVLIALVLPGNKVVPLGDLPNLISVMSLSVLMFRGNVFRAVVAGMPVIITFLLIASNLAPLYTQLAGRAPSC